MLLLVSGFIGLAFWSGFSFAASQNDIITDDSYFYGQSPPVYPSPEMRDDPAWGDAFDKAKKMVQKMTLEEKVNLTSGNSLDNGCSGNIPAIERVGFPGLCLSDAGNGLRATDFVSAFPSGLHVGASWNRDLTHRRGIAMGSEFKKKGVNVLLGPVVGPSWRVVRGGRNWEGFSVDPYLSGSLVYQSVLGVQEQGVTTSTKHFIANEQETNRNPGKDIAAVSSNIDDKTMHELYLWPFQDAVRAGTGNIMCSYQRINNSYGCANSKTMNGLLKTELGFQGYVVTDWNALHSGVDSALAGVDMAMPNDGGFFGPKLVEASKNGSLPESRITDMATRIIASWYQVKQDVDFPRPGVGMPKDVTKPHKIVDGRSPENRPTLFNGAVEGHILVKNTKNTLPLKSPRMLSLFGYSAKSPDQYSPTALTGVDSWSLGAEPIDIHEIYLDQIYGSAANHSTIGLNGTMIGGGGSGANNAAVFLSPFEAIKFKAFQESTSLFHDFISANPAVNPATDACIVFGNAWASEGYDRPAIWDNYTDTLINTVADQCEKTIVVLYNAGPRLVDGFVDHPNVTAIMFAHLPGQETGAALVSLLYGEVSPSGKLPYTVAKNDTDYAALLNPDLPEGKFKQYPQSDFKEGVFLDYRHFDEKNIEPRYEFGFGLSYTKFNFSNITIERIENANTDEWPTGAIITGGQADLWAYVYAVEVDVTNIGKVAGAEVTQLYVGIPNAPKKQLRGFDKTLLEPGQSTTVRFGLTRRDLSVWDTTAQKWHLQRGEHHIYVGNSARNLPLRGTLAL